MLDGTLSLSSTPALVEDSRHEARRSWVTGPQHVCFRLLRWGHGYRCPRGARHNQGDTHYDSATGRRRTHNDCGANHHRSGNHDSGTNHHSRPDHHRDTNNYFSGLNNHRRADALCCTNNDHLANQYRIFLIGAAPKQCDCWMWIVFFAAAGSRVV